MCLDAFSGVSSLLNEVAKAWGGEDKKRGSRGQNVNRRGRGETSDEEQRCRNPERVRRGERADVHGRDSCWCLELPCALVFWGRGRRFWCCRAQGRPPASPVVLVVIFQSCGGGLGLVVLGACCHLVPCFGFENKEEDWGSCRAVGLRRT